MAETSEVRDSTIGADVQSKGQVRVQILSLAWPVVMRMLLQSIVGMVDIMMVGRLGPASIAAVSLGNRLVFILVGALQALAVGATALVAQYTGAGDRSQAQRVVVQALVGAFLLALALGFAGVVLAPTLIRGMLSLMEDLDMVVVEMGTIYLRIVLISMVFGLPQILINALFQGFGDMKTPLYIMTISNVLNVVANYLLIFGVGPFPALGVTGAAIATGLARVVGCFIGLFLLVRGTSAVKLRWQELSLRLDYAVLRRILAIGIPASLEQFVRQSAMIFFSFFVASLGTLALAANEIIINAQSISFMPGFGFGLVATTLVGQSLGADNKSLAARYGMETMKMGVLLMGTAGIAFVIWPQALIHLYTNDVAVIAVATAPMRVVAILQPLFAIVLILAGALRGAGDTKWVFYATLIGNWGVRLSLGAAAALFFDIGLTGFWIIVALDMAVRAALFLMRYRSGLWQKRLVEAPPSIRTELAGQRR